MMKADCGELKAECGMLNVEWATLDSLSDNRICGILSRMSTLNPGKFKDLYANFDAPITAFDCGKKCAPYNEYGVPFCCDTNHAIPTAYLSEWDYLQPHTDLWHLWEGNDPQETEELGAQTPDGQLLIECLGHHFCQRGFRSITCRAFPFFPYVTLQGEFIGLSYYWEYEDRCWVINHLEVVTPEYVREFMAAYDWIFRQIPGELENFRYHAIIMRRIFGRQKRTIPLLHQDGRTFAIIPNNGVLEPVDPSQLPKHGPYAIAAEMPFPDEL
jgi:hypothetical protein